MDTITFSPGASISGVLHLYDPKSDTQPMSAATLSFTETGVEVAVSNAAGAFASLLFGTESTSWFGGDVAPPAQCLFHSIDGSLTLTGLALVQRRSGSYVETASFRVHETTFAATRTRIDEPINYDKLYSQIDGLSGWWSVSAIDYEVEHDDAGLAKGVQISTRPVEPIEWHQGRATMRLEMNWHSESLSNYSGMSLTQKAMLSSEFPDASSADAHLDEHWKVRSLLVAIHGHAFPYLDHEVVSNDCLYTEMPPRFAGQPPARIASRREFVTTRTVREREVQPSSGNGAERPILFLRDIGAEGLARWGDAWDSDWERLINPVTSALSRHRPYLEDQIMAAGIFIDGWGARAARAAGEDETYARNRRTFSTCAYRALAASCADWTPVADTKAGLARAMRRIYTAVKHAELQQPEPLEMSLISRIMLLLVRMVIARRVDLDGALVRGFATDPGFIYGLSIFELNGVRINKDGKFVPWE